MTQTRPSVAARPALPRTVKGLSLVSLLNDVASEMVYPLLPAFVTGTLGAGAIALGALDGAADLASAAFRWVSGRLADRRGWRGPLVGVGYAIAVAVRPLVALTGAAWQVVGLRVLDRLGKGLRSPPRDALIAAATPVALRGRAFGLHRAADHGGAVLGSLVAWWLLQRGMAVRDVIVWSVVPGVAVLLVLAAVLRGRAEEKGAAPVSSAGGGEAVRWAPIVALALLALARLPEMLLLLRLQDLGVAVSAIPLLWAALHVVRSAAAYPGGWLSDHLGPRALVAAGGALFAGVALALSAALGVAAAAGAFLVFGLVAGLTEPAERALVARLSPARLGRGFGAYHALTGVAALPAGLVFGWVYERWGGGAALGATAVATLAAIGLWIAASRETSGSRSHGLPPHP